jgi:hypothetical protein
MIRYLYYGIGVCTVGCVSSVYAKYKNTVDIKSRKNIRIALYCCVLYESWYISYWLHKSLVSCYHTNINNMLYFGLKAGLVYTPSIFISYGFILASIGHLYDSIKDIYFS